MMIPTTAPFSIERPADANPAMAPARAGTDKKITRSIGWKFVNGFTDANTTKSVPERIPTRIARSRCWNLAAVTEIDCSIKVGFKDRLVLICCFCGKPKCEKTQIYRKKYTATFNISISRATFRLKFISLSKGISFSCAENKRLVKTLVRRRVIGSRLRYYLSSERIIT